MEKWEIEIGKAISAWKFWPAQVWHEFTMSRAYVNQNPV
jgi:hypothetical protein